MRPGVICLTLSYAALGYFQYLFFYWIQYYIGTVQHLGDRRVAAIFDAHHADDGTGNDFRRLAGRPCLAALVAGRSRRRLVPALGMIASGLVFEFGLLSSDSRVMVTAFILSAGLLGMCEAAFWTTIVELGMPRGGLAAGLMNMGGNAGGLLSPVATPLLSALFRHPLWPGARLADQPREWRVQSPCSGALMWFGVKSRTERQDGSRSAKRDEQCAET